MNNRPLKIIVFGAHPDDCDIKAGGIAIKYAHLGHAVNFIFVAHGDALTEDRIPALFPFFD